MPNAQAIVPKGEVATVPVLHFHDVGYFGTEHTLAQIREKYWVQQKDVKKILRRCITCKKMNGRSCTQKMADLPDSLLP